VKWLGDVVKLTHVMKELIAYETREARTVFAPHPYP